MKKRILFILAALLTLSCEQLVPPSEPKLVVEGWIQNGGHPIVLLSESLPVELGKEITANDMISSLAKWAKVTVNDGAKTVTLTGMVDENYFPPYVFSTNAITGEVGKSYSLRIEYKDYVVTGETTIPEPVPLDTVYVASVQDSLCYVKCGFTDPPQKGNNYKFMTRTPGVDSRYHSSALAQLDDSQLDGYSEVFLYSTLRLMSVVAMPNLRLGEELWVKLCTLDQKAYEYWRDFEVMLYATTFNMDFGVDNKGNVQGGLGYWVGYGVDKEVCIKLEEPKDSKEKL